MAKQPPKSRGLGRGLSALMSDVPSPETDAAPAVAERHIPTELIEANPNQPRKTFNDNELRELSDSIRQKGIIQPLIVRPSPNGGNKFQIVAGERRWRAAQIAKMHSLPVVVRDLSDTEVLELAIIENIQRADLNPVEEALGYRQLMDSFGHTQEQMATAMGKSRSHIANILRLLQLPEPVLKYLREGKLTAGHARALIPAEDPLGVAKQVIGHALNVRQTEALVAKEKASGQTSKSKGKAPEKDADTKALEGDLSAQLKMKVSISHAPGHEGGTLSIGYKDLDQLDDLCRLLSGY
ncbi:ParB/RepB/Spo0J family partition protein [Nereida sp. MMG025]|uniref:ParB/RepB/Spo0J family partition protein n=1 Tax=Nereida sp. MMG025 TaxID=2909981 RepID=UPI001F0181E3|nr:ParB/RepB/Spo0J family partition protein [Nereida sp. MMG025]MCF6444619.1 ParB/RepB/Spo0J family partition protein [Nereida sp. MMG025]